MGKGSSNKNGTKEEVAQLLPLVYSRAFNASIKSIKEKFNCGKLKILPTKSTVYSISGVKGEVQDGYVPMVPLIINVKKYLPSVERTSEHIVRSCKDEYDREDRILALGEQILKHERGHEIILVYPKSYSAQVDECHEKLYIFREYIPGETLEKTVSKLLNSKKPDEVEWKDLDSALKTPLLPIALLHAKGQILESALPSSLQLHTTTMQEMIEGFAHYLWRISQKKISLGKIKREISKSAETIFKEYLTSEEYRSVINGDLDVYTGNLIITGNSSRLLDAGSTEKSAFFRDLAVYSDPSFSPVKDIERAVSKDYLDTLQRFKEELHLEKKEFDLDKISLGFCAAAWRGNIRRAASLIHYKQEQVENSEALKNQVAEHIKRSFYFLDKLQQGSTNGVKRAIDRINQGFDKLNVFNYYFPASTKDSRKSAESSAPSETPVKGEDISKKTVVDKGVELTNKISTPKEKPQ